MDKDKALDLALKTLGALKAVYRIGFQSSGEGYNGEYPFNFENPEVDSDWCIRRDEKMKMVAKYAQKEIELYTTPPAQHEFVGLTDVEVLHLEVAPFMTIREVYAVIEAKLKEKNNV